MANARIFSGANRQLGQKYLAKASQPFPCRKLAWPLLAAIVNMAQNDSILKNPADRTSGHAGIGLISRQDYPAR
jgi:hypothetical protein